MFHGAQCIGLAQLQCKPEGCGLLVLGANHCCTRDPQGLRVGREDTVVPILYVCPYEMGIIIVQCHKVVSV